MVKETHDAERIEHSNIAVAPFQRAVPMFALNQISLDGCTLGLMFAP